jgi:hypothetical protein
MTTPVMVTVAWALSWHLPENVPTHPGSMGLSSAPATTVGLCLSGCIRGPRCPPPSALRPLSSVLRTLRARWVREAKIIA